MDEYQISYREVIPDQTNPEKWKEIILNTGGTHSTLQDIKVAEKAGGYSYKDETNSYNRNRFLYWRTSHDILELSEISMDFNLIDNYVRYKFADSPVLSVDIFEDENNIILLIATVCSIHRLNFPKLNKSHRSGQNDAKLTSIFTDATAHAASNPTTFHAIRQSASAHNPIPHTASSWLLPTGNEALFALAYQTSLILFTMNTNTGSTQITELKQHNYVPRILSNLTEALRGNKRNLSDSQFVTSLVFDEIGGHAFLYALYRDDHVRMWSTKSAQCVANVNCLQEGTEPRPQGPQTNLLRKASSSTLCAFLSHSCGSEFVVIEIGFDGMSNFSLTRMHMIPAREYDLVDFEINISRIWGLWCNSHGDFKVSSHSLTSKVDHHNWISAALEPPPDRFSIPIGHGMDLRQTYCSYIFHPGKFQKFVVSKALTMFKRSSILPDTDITMSTLKDYVCQAVENEIQNEKKGYDISDDEYFEIAARHWERFYSCCEQYHVKACQPIGLVQFNSAGAMCLVKKKMFSLLRPCEPIEHLMLSCESASVDDLAETNLAVNLKSSSDLVQLVGILAYIEDELMQDVKNEIDKKLYQMQLPNEVVVKMILDLNEFDDSILSEKAISHISDKLQLILNLPSAMIQLLETLKMDNEEMKPIESYSTLGKYTHKLLAITNLFGSYFGISLLAESLRQTSLVRYSLSRNILVLQALLIEIYKISSTQVEIIRSKCMPETVVFIQAYYVMVWLCETPVYSTSTAAIESSIQRLSSLQLVDSRQYVSRPQNPISILELFLRDKGLQTCLAQYASGPYENFSDSSWQYTLLPLVKIAGQLVWAVSGNFVFGEWLMGSCQHILIQEYVQLLNSWCEWNNCSRHFILAVSLLDNGEKKKAYKLFMQADRGVLTEPFLIEKFLPSKTSLSPNDAVAEYYLKIIQFFEQYSALDCIILMARAAINVLDEQDSKLAMFQSIVFSNHLVLGHYEEAYESLIHNAEPSRRKDCLRQLIVTLFQEKRLNLLMRFPYIGLQEQLENIIESRARSMMVEDNNHYDFLYSFHITKCNMRKASSIMYERAMRYLLECDSVAAMQSRYHCLLACVNALYLIDEKYAWIAKPVINDENNMDVDTSLAKEKIIVLEIKDIKKELLLTEAVLLIAKFKEEIGPTINAGASEIIAILTSLGLYTAAIRLALGFNLGISNILDSITIACINALSQDAKEVWNWLLENDITDFSMKNNAIDTAWNLLKDIIETNEEQGSTSLRKTVTRKILSTDAFVPQWLYSSYKASNTPEILNLFVTNGRLIEATELAVEYVRAMLEGGIEYFGLPNTLNSTQNSLCFPINTIDNLLYGLKTNITDDDYEYEECYNELLHIVTRYVETAKRVSHDKVQFGLLKI